MGRFAKKMKKRGRVAPDMIFHEEEVVSGVFTHFPDLSDFPPSHRFPYVSDLDRTPEAIQRPRFRDALQVVRKQKLHIVGATPRAFGTQALHFQNARMAVQREGGQLIVVADTIKERVQGILRDERLAPLLERVAAGRRIDVAPCSVCTQDHQMHATSTVPGKDFALLTFVHDVTLDDIARELVQLDMIDAGYPMLLVEGGHHLTGAINEAEVSRRLRAMGIDPVSTTEGRLRDREGTPWGLMTTGYLFTEHVQVSMAEFQDKELQQRYLAQLAVGSVDIAGAGERIIDIIRSEEGAFATPAAARELYSRIAGALLEDRVLSDVRVIEDPRPLLPASAE
jgi:hypothetical protein